MKVVIAPDSFKETLDAAEVAEALAQGVLAAVPDAWIDLCPMADGGEGTVAAMVAATGGQFLTADVFNPLGSPIRARFGLLGSSRQPGLPGLLGVAAAASRADGEGTPIESTGGRAAVIEMAAASGLALVAPELRDPLRTTTFGTGQLIRAALDAGAAEIIVGVGGSATVDGGCGAAQALGVTFLGRDGEPAVCGLAGGGLADVARIDLSDRDERIAATRIRVACDVRNVLTGPDGAAAVYAPQKGATPEMVEQLEAGLVHLAGLIREQLGLDVAGLAGAGAAGGLGAGLVAFAAAMLEAGAELVAEAVGLGRRLRGADLCITGEGRLDASSAFGKTPVHVAALAAELGVPTVCIPGQAAEGAPSTAFADVLPLVTPNVTAAAAMDDPRRFLTLRAAEAARRFARR